MPGLSYEVGGGGFPTGQKKKQQINTTIVCLSVAENFRRETLVGLHDNFPYTLLATSIWTLLLGVDVVKKGPARVPWVATTAAALSGRGPTTERIRARDPVSGSPMQTSEAPEGGFGRGPILALNREFGLLNPPNKGPP